MSYQLQHGALANELAKAGIPLDAASRIASILSNSQQATRSGPQTQDLTPSQMRRVTPGVRKYQLTGLDFREGDPDYRKARYTNSQSRQSPEQISTVQSQKAPQQTESPLKVSGGEFTNVSSQGDSVSVGLRVQPTGQFLTIDQSSNAIVGKNIRLESSSENDGIVKFFLEDRGDELVLKLSLDVENLASRLGIDTVTNNETTIQGEGPVVVNRPDPTKPEEETPCSGGTSATVITGVQCVNGDLVVTTGQIDAVRCS